MIAMRKHSGKIDQRFSFQNRRAFFILQSIIGFYSHIEITIPIKTPFGINHDPILKSKSGFDPERKK